MGICLHAHAIIIIVILHLWQVKKQKRVYPVNDSGVGVNDYLGIKVFPLGFYYFFIALICKMLSYIKVTSDKIGISVKYALNRKEDSTLLGLDWYLMFIVAF